MTLSGTDELDRKIIKQLLTGPKTVRQIVVALMGNTNSDGAKARRAYQKIGYRLQEMIDDTYVEKNHKNKTYTLVNITYGPGKIIIEPQDKEHEILEVDELIFVHHNEGTSIIYL